MLRNTKIYVRKAAALLMALSLLCGAFSVSLAEAFSGVQVRSSVLNNNTITADGMVRVYLASLGSPTLLNLRIRGQYSAGATGGTLTDGTAVTVSFQPATGEITLSWNGRTINMGRNVTLRRHGSSSSYGIQISQSLESANPYPGDLELRAVYGSSGYQLYTIVHVYIENYLYGVLPYEMGNSSNIEALKAQAVAARTYTVRMMKSRASGMYDVKDTTSDQVYRGTPSGNANCVSAVDATKGIVLMYGSSYITTYYSSSNGGQTEASRSGTSYAYMSVKDDPFDYANPNSTVKRKTIYADLQSGMNSVQLIDLLKTKAVAKLNQSGYYASYGNVTLGTLKSVTPHTPMYASPSRLYTKMDFQFTVFVGGASTSVTVTCDIFGELEGILSLGIQSMKNELWSVASGSGSFEIQVRRYGHGMGMSQRGAMYMAKLGYTYDQILGFYYEGCTRVKHSFTHTFITPSGNEQVNVETPAEDEWTSQSTCYGTVKLSSTGTSLAIRNAKSSGASVIGSVSNGAKVDVLYSNGTWCLIQFGELRGYVPASSLLITGTPEGTDLGASVILGFAKVTAGDFVNLRAGESTNTGILGTAPAGAVLTVFSRSGNWARVQYNALTAYVNTGYISAVSQNYPENNLSSGDDKAYVITEDGGSVNLRQSASTGAPILTGIATGTEVKVLSDDGSWSYVSVFGMQGYMMSSYLRRTDDEPEVLPPENVTQENSIRAIVATQSGALNMRALPQTGSLILTSIPKGALVTVTGYGDEWSLIEYNGITGHVMTRYLHIEGAEEDESPRPEKADKAVVVTPGGTLNLRMYPQTGSEILFQIPQGMEVEVHEYGNEWSFVSFGGIRGYVMTMFLSFDQYELEQPEQEQPDSQPGSAEQAVVTTGSGSLNMRMDPSSTAGIICQIPQYATVDVIHHGQQWSMVRWQGNIGYVMSSYLSFGEDRPQQKPSEPNVQQAYVLTASGSLNLRAEPNAASAVLCAVPRYGVVEVLGYGDAWCAVTYGTHTGYVMTRYLAFDDPPQEKDEPQNGQTVKTLRVNTSFGALNLRSEPNINAQILLAVPQYAEVTSYGTENSWSYVSYQGVYGYVMSSYLAESAGDMVVEDVDITMQIPAQACYAVAREGAVLTLWSSCSESGEVIGVVEPYEKVEIILLGNEWCCVEYQGTQGYCRTEWLSVME